MEIAGDYLAKFQVRVPIYTAEQPRFISRDGSKEEKGHEENIEEEDRAGKADENCCADRLRYTKSS